MHTEPSHEAGSPSVQVSRLQGNARLPTSDHPTVFPTVAKLGSKTCHLPVCFLTVCEGDQCPFVYWPFTLSLGHQPCTYMCNTETSVIFILFYLRQIVKKIGRVCDAGVEMLFCSGLWQRKHKWGRERVLTCRQQRCSHSSATCPL